MDIDGRQLHFFCAEYAHTVPRVEITVFVTIMRFVPAIRVDVRFV
jgi:hypothetical protein